MQRLVFVLVLGISVVACSSPAAEEDQAACDRVEEALNVVESADFVSSALAAASAEVEIEETVRRVGSVASEAELQEVRERGVEASQAVREGDIETATLHLQSAAADCRRNDIPVEVTGSVDPDPALHANRLVCDVVTDMDPEAMHRSWWGSEMRAHELLPLLQREAGYLEGDVREAAEEFGGRSGQPAVGQSFSNLYETCGGDLEETEQ